MNRKILLIDSDEEDRRKMAGILIRFGYRNVSFAQNGKEGVERIKVDKPNVVVVALALSDCSGFAICKEIKTLKETDAKTILITGKLSSIEPEWKKNSNADAFIIKTATYEALIHAVSTLV